jgi:predicted molibdopterin-dependent oxidoreductase YjgC
VLARHYANGQGCDDLGIRPERAPRELQGARDLAGLREALREGRIKGLLVWGENPVADSAWASAVEGASFVVAADLAPTETTRAADVALPASAVSESDGSLTAMDRRVQDVRRAFAPRRASPASRCWRGCTRSSRARRPGAWRRRASGSLLPTLRTSR